MGMLAAKLASRFAAVAVALVAALGAASAASAASAATPAMPLVTVSPLAGTPDASPGTQISFLGAPAKDISQISVRGSLSGSHAGKLEAYATGTGVSYVPLRAFTPGEQVTVTAVETYGGATLTLGTSFSIGSIYTLPPRTGSTGATGATGAASFVSMPTIHPATVSVTTQASDPALGDVFLTPVSGGTEAGAMIVNPAGQMVWFAPAPPGEQDADLRVQSYLGKDVLTYWQGRIAGGHGIDGTGVIDNSSYHEVAQVHAGNGLSMDLHDFRLEPDGVAYITVFEPVYYDLHPFGGPARGIVDDCVIQEIDVRTGLVMFEWHALGHIPLSDSYSKVPTSSESVWDYFHINSIDVEPDHNLVISSRNTWSIYGIGHSHGEVLWTLGGKHGNFNLGPGVRFAWQHDATLISPHRLEVFDNEDTPEVGKSSRALEIDVNYQTHTATLDHQYLDPGQPVLSPSQGDIQQLTNADQFVGWGQVGIASEFSLRGALTFQLTLPPLVESYRAYRFPWSAQPLTLPAVAASRVAGATTTQAAVSWNGATDVVAWQLYAGASRTSFRAVGAPVASTGFETSIAAATTAPYVAVQAVGVHGRVLATSAAVAVTAPSG
jgi:hypothetical protein